MKKKTTIIIIGLIVIFMVAGLIAPLMSKGRDKNDAPNNTDNNSSDKTDYNVDIIVHDSDDHNDDDDNKGTTPSGSGGGKSENTASPSADPTNSNSQPESHDQNNDNAAKIPTIAFPYVIEGTDIVVEQIGSYDGYFIEDGSDKEVSGIAAIILKNNGGDLRFVGIGISQGERSLAFSGSIIPAGATVVLQEQNGAAYSASDPYYSATASTESTDGFEMSEDLVSVKDNTNGGLTVTNISGKMLPLVKIYYKNYLPDEKAYVGGITYCITLKDVEPETSTDVSASHYDSKYGKVLEVIVEQ